MATKEMGLKQLPSGKWQYSAWVDGHYIRRVAKNKFVAKQNLEALRTQRAEGKDLDSVVRSKFTFEQGVKRFLKWSKGNVSDSQYEIDEWASKKWLSSPCFAGKALNRVRAEDVEQFKEDLKATRLAGKLGLDGKTMSKRSVDISVGRLKHMFKLCRAWKLTTGNPTEFVKLYNEDVIMQRFLADEEEKKLLGVSDPDLATMIRIAIRTGMRRGEILGLSWDRVHFKAETIALPSGLVKNRKWRMVPMSPQVKKLLEAIEPKEPGTFVFWPWLTNEQSRLVHWKRRWKKARVEASVDGIDLRTFRFHDNRHTFASRAIQRGGYNAVVPLQRILGHSGQKITERYIHLLKSNLSDTVKLTDGPDDAI